MSLEQKERIDDIESKADDISVYDGSQIGAMRSKQLEMGDEFTAVVSDNDNSFHRTDMPAESWKNYEYALSKSVPIIIVTGVNIKDVAKRVNSKELPPYQIIASSVGTEIWVLRQDGDDLKYEKDLEFEEILLDGGFVREDLLPISFDMVETFRDKFQDVNFVFQEPGLEQQRLNSGKTDPNDNQRFKISFYFETDDLGQVKEIKEAAEKIFPNQKIVISGMTEPSDSRQKYCLDLLPVTKADSANYLIEKLGINRGIVVGDSGNDSGLLLNTKKLFPTVVGGARPELIEAIEAHKKENNMTKSGSFFRTQNSDQLPMYVERSEGKRKGPQSVRYAATVLERAENLKKIRDQKEKENGK